MGLEGNEKESSSDLFLQQGMNALFGNNDSLIDVMVENTDWNYLSFCFMAKRWQLWNSQFSPPNKRLGEETTRKFHGATCCGECRLFSLSVPTKPMLLLYCP